MYYVIKRQRATPMSHFIGFQVPKYIAAKNNENVILEFIKDGKPNRKWIKREDIILLTDNKDFFLKTMKHFKSVEDTQKQLVEEAQKKLDESVETFSETMNSEIEEFNEVANSDDARCILKDL